MMAEDAQNEGLSDDHRATEIHTYLNSFKKEIQAVAGEEETLKTEEETTEYEHESKNDYALMYYTSADGTLYSAKALQTGFSQPATLITNNVEQNRNELSAEGPQHVIVALGDSGNFVLSDAKGLSYTLSTTPQGSVFKEDHDSTTDLTKHPNIGVQPASNTDRENVVPVKGSASNEISKVGSELSNNFPQIYQLLSNGTDQAIVKDSTAINGNTMPVITSGAYQTVTVMPSDTNPGQMNYVLFVSPVDRLDTKSVNESAKLLTVDGEIADEKTEVFDPPPDRSLNVYKCQYCDYTSTKRYLLSRHLKSHSDERPHKCKVCERGFKTLASLQNHMNTHTKTRPHACKECDSTFTTSGELVRHIRYKHTHERPHHCTECDYASVELSKLKRHMRCHTGERPYQCPHCTYASPDTYKLKRHLRTHTGEKPYTCNVCQTCFTQSNSLKAHLLIHTGNKPSYQCTFCPATCGRKTDLRIHMQKLHSSDKTHKCKRCGKTFKDKYSFKVHCKTHDGEKSFKCTACPFMTISLQQFEAHTLAHGNEELYQCMTCNDSFNHKQLLKQHMELCHNSHCNLLISKDIKCPECGKAFRHHENMIRHSAVHDPGASSAKREEATQIGRPKEPGEIRDGEEDELSDENLNDNQAVFELLQKFSEDENKNLFTANRQLLTLTEHGNGYTVVPHSSGENTHTVISSFSNNVRVDEELQAPLRIEFEGESSETEVNENCEPESETDHNNDHSHNLHDSNKSPQIIQIVAQHQKIPVGMDVNEPKVINEES